jgi:hypothetical protein
MEEALKATPDPEFIITRHYVAIDNFNPLSRGGVEWVIQRTQVIKVETNT